MPYTKDREAFTARMMTEIACNPNRAQDSDAPSWSVRLDIIRGILRDAATHHRLCETDCNDGLTDKQSRQSDACERRITERVKALGPGFGVMFSGDPRGATVKILLPSGYSDSWGGEGFCVPVRS